MDHTTLKRLIGVNVILITGVIHLYQVRGEAQESTYLGPLFYAYFLAALLSTIGISEGGRLWGWALGAFISAGAIVGYISSRTVGLPVLGVHVWGPSMAFVAIALELIFIIAFLTTYSLDARRAY